MNANPIISVEQSSKMPLFVTGNGQSDTHALEIDDRVNGGKKRNPHPMAGQPYQQITGPQIAALAQNPMAREKSAAPWFIPSTYADHDARSHEVQREKGEYRILPGDIDTGNHSLEDVNSALDKVIGAGCSRIIYSTSSATPVHQKWRFILFLSEPLAGADYKDTQDALFALMCLNGIRCDQALNRPGQLVFLPNVPPEKRKEDGTPTFYKYHLHRGQTLTLDGASTIYTRREAIRQDVKRATEEVRGKREVRLVASEMDFDEKPITHFNKHHTVAELLERYGYERDGKSNDWRSPNQTSGSYATRVFEGEAWASLSGSDMAAGIGIQKDNCCCGDAFDLYKHYEHNGDEYAAVRAYGETINPRPLANVFSAFTEPGKAQGDLPAPVPAAKPKRTSQFYCAATLKDKRVHPREWLVEGLIPQKTVTLFSGDGGTGKSLLSLQLAVSVAAGRSWIGKYVNTGSVIYMSAEDDNDELHRRLDDILRADNRKYDDVKGLTLRSLAGEDALLAIETQVQLMKSELFKELEARAADDAPSLIVIDTLADVYPANENDRAKVRQFIGILRGLALKRDCSVLLLGHPSLTGLSTGSGSSGSTAWNNSVRSRLYLSRITDSGYEADPDRRVLTTMKANYGRVGEETHMTWQSGVFVAEASESGLDKLASDAMAQRVFLKLLAKFTAQGRQVNHVSGASFAPTVFAEHPESEGMTKRALRAAMEGLLASGKVEIRKEGPASRRRSYLAEASK